MKNVYAETNTLKVIEGAIKENIPLLLVGETGTGKTTLLKEFAKSKKKNLIRVSLNGNSGTEEILGKYLLIAGETKWQDGILTQAVRTGEWIVFDEINSCSPEILFALHSILDNDKSLLLSEKDNERIEAHKDFRFFASMNPDDYAGTKTLNQAFISRFSIVEIDVMSEVDEIKFLVEKMKITEAKASEIVSVATTLRDLKKKEQIDYFCSTRDLELVCSFVKTLPLEVAFNVSVFNKMTSLEKQAIIGSYSGFKKFISSAKNTLESKIAQFKEIESKLTGHESKLKEVAELEKKSSNLAQNIKEAETIINVKLNNLLDREKNFDQEVDKEVVKRISSLIK